MKYLSRFLAILLIISFLTVPVITRSKTDLNIVQNQSCTSLSPSLSDLNSTTTFNASGSDKLYQAATTDIALVENPDDTYFDKQFELKQLQIPQSWNFSCSNNSIKIAVLDSGIDASHEDLATKIVAKINFTDSKTPQDIYGHGTAVAGVAAAIANNNLGISGVGYNASLMNVKVLDDNGAGDYTRIIQGIIWATDNGANIINLSIDGRVDSPFLKQAIDYAWNRGVLIVAATGNNGTNNATFPAGYEHCIAVAATDRYDQKSPYSDYGDWIDVAAPGGAYSTLPGNKYGYKAGTSMAASYVSGLAALAFSVATDTNGDGKLNDEVRAAIENGCDPLIDPGTGKGRINALKTLLVLLPP